MRFPEEPRKEASLFFLPDDPRVPSLLLRGEGGFFISHLREILHFPLTAGKDCGLQTPTSDGGRRPAGVYDAGPGGCGCLALHGLPSAQRGRPVQPMDSSRGTKSVPTRLPSTQEAS